MRISGFLKKKPQPKNLQEFMCLHQIETQRELSRYLGVSESYLSYYFRGKRKFGKKLALKIHKKTGIPLENLLF